MDALDTYYNDRCFEGNDCSALPVAGRLSSFFDASRPSSTLIDFNDPDLILNAFDKAFEKSNAVVTPYQFKDNDDPRFIYGGYTHFTSYASGEGKSFINQITYNPLRTADQNTVSQIHEKFHAIQWSTIPELHAVPNNMLAYQEVPIILSPRSWVIASFLTEREAYAKTAWIATLQDKQNQSNALEAAMGGELVQPKDIEYWRSLYPDDLGFALGAASLIWDELIRARKQEDGSEINLRDHYIDLAIRQYNKKNSPRLHTWKTAANPIFIDLDDQAILSMGSSFGPSIFGKYSPDPVFKDLKLTPKQEKSLRDLEGKLGIQPGQKLPTLREALAERGMTTEQYMQRSKAYIDVPPQQQLQSDMSIAL